MIKTAVKIALLIIGGTIMGRSFSQINSFSAELLFGLGAVTAVAGFYV